MRLAVTSMLFAFGACAAYGHDDLVLRLEEALVDLGYQPGAADGTWDDDGSTLYFTREGEDRVSAKATTSQSGFSI